ncbi:MAG: tyrosine-type recombinase/integrase [Burkholderiaceae bacterium]|nr:tyrosine-type recombinase/integrase [Burkholderiaceae bacterium]
MKTTERLNALAVKSATTPGYYLDGNGLHLQVARSGSKSWVLQFTLNGKRREMGIGSAGVLSLAQARAKAQQYRLLLADGVDPIEARDTLKLKAASDAAKTRTFKQCAEDFIKDRRAEWTNEKHAQQWENTLATYAYPHIGALPVSAIDMDMVRKCLDPIWTTKTETASRVRQRIEKVLDSAKAKGMRSGDNPAAWRGCLEPVMPKPSKVAKSENHAALEYAALPTFIASIQRKDGVAALALELAILTAGRTGEILGARPEEFDLKAKTWTVPAERMKAGVEHTVPLSPRAVEIVKRMRAEHPESAWVFPGARKGKPLSNMAMMELVRGMGTTNAAGEGITVHGFRSTFRQWAAEQTHFPREVAEHALAHRLPDKVEAAYQRSTMVDKRRALMIDWGAFAGRPVSRARQRSN